MEITKQKKTYWKTVLSEDYQFQYRATRDAESVTKTGVLAFSQTYGVGVKVRGKKVLRLSLRYPMEPMFALFISCDRIDNIWEVTVESLNPTLCEAFAEGSISATEFAEGILRDNPIDERFRLVAKGITPWGEGEDVHVLEDYLVSGLASWVSNGSGLRQE